MTRYEKVIKNRSEDLFQLASNMWIRDDSALKTSEQIKTITNEIPDNNSVREENKTNRIKGGDIKFNGEVQNKLSPYVASIGKNLLIGIRQWYNGELEYHKKGKNYVETPENFSALEVG